LVLALVALLLRALPLSEHALTSTSMIRTRDARLKPLNRETDFNMSFLHLSDALYPLRILFCNNHGHYGCLLFNLYIAYPEKEPIGSVRLPILVLLPILARQITEPMLLPN
jgi:hypothetical protein